MKLKHSEYCIILVSIKIKRDWETNPLKLHFLFKLLKLNRYWYFTDLNISRRLHQGVNHLFSDGAVDNISWKKLCLKKTV